jgi:hypothetical protein
VAARVQVSRYRCTKSIYRLLVKTDFKFTLNPK